MHSEVGTGSPQNKPLCPVGRVDSNPPPSSPTEAVSFRLRRRQLSSLRGNQQGCIPCSHKGRAGRSNLSQEESVDDAYKVPTTERVSNTAMIINSTQGV